jgi:peptidoglycan hydrolase CwlO-like protein
MENKIKKTIKTPTNSSETQMTDDEVSSVVELSTQYQEILGGFGELYLRKLQVEEENKRIDEMEQELKSTYSTINQRENDIVERFTKKYGQGRVDTARGVYVKEKKSI